MTLSDFLRLPPGVQTLVVVMLWPAIWAGVSMSIALAGDRIRQAKQAKSLTRARGALD